MTTLNTSARKPRQRFTTWLRGVSVALAAIITPAAPAQEALPGAGPKAASGDRADIATINVTATRSREARVPGQVTVIDHNQIERLQPANVADLLRGISGVDVTQAGGRGNIPFVSVRGGEPNFTLVLLDGIPVNDPTNTRGGGFDLNLVDVNLVDSIEIHKGGVSAVHGGDAMNGVIHIRTRGAGSSPGGRVRLRASSDPEQAGSLSARSGTRPLYGALNAARSSRRATISGVEHDGAQASAVLGYDQGALRTTARFLYAKTDASVFPEDSGGPRLAAIDRSALRDGEQLAAALRTTWTVARQISVGADFAWSRHSEDESSPGIAPGVFGGVPPSDLSTTYERHRASAWSNLVLPNAAELVLGLSFDREDSAADGSFDVGFPLPAEYKFDRETLSGFAELTTPILTHFILGLGVRHDMPDSNANQTTARVALSAKPVGLGIRPFLAWSENFKLPSIFALANPLVGNPNLRPERSKAAEIGAEFNRLPLGLRSRMTFFHTRYRELVDFDPALFTNVNRDSVEIIGVEFDASLLLGAHLSARINYTWTDIDTASSGVDLRRRPRHKGSLSALWQFNDSWRLAATLFVSGDFADSSIASGAVEVDGYEQLNLVLSGDLTSHVRLHVGLRNVLDQRFEETIGVPDPGIGLNGSLSYAF